MSATPDCPHCQSHDVRRLNAAVTGVSGFRCHECAEIFYVASSTVMKRIQQAQANRETGESEKPRRRAAHARKT
jgi:transposase-like protein